MSKKLIRWPSKEISKNFKLTFGEIWTKFGQILSKICENCEKIVDI